MPGTPAWVSSYDKGTGTITSLTGRKIVSIIVLFGLPELDSFFIKKQSEQRGCKKHKATVSASRKAAWFGYRNRAAEVLL